MIKIITADKFVADELERGLSTASVYTTVSEIIADVKLRKDAALFEYTERFDGCRPEAFEVTDDEIKEAISKTKPDFIEIMKRAKSNIEAFHENQIQQGFIMTSPDGVILGQRIIPLKRAGIYVPGGTAAYPSTVLMNCIPAKIAKVEEVIIATPPGKDGKIAPAILAAASISGADRIFKIGGAQAIAAMAFGTESIPKVDKITGPGNAYVAEAKRQVYGIVGIDMIAGPSDILIIANENANSELVAADMLSQCEHGEDSIAILITTSHKLAQSVRDEIENQLTKLPREAIARKSIDNLGLIIVTENTDTAFDIANEIAPEHLEILLDDPFSYLGKVTNAGSVFLGKNTPEVLADYYAGPNHTLPTSGTARFSGPLSVDDFIKKSSFTSYTENAFNKIANDVASFALEEEFTAHANSVTKRVSQAASEREKSLGENS